MEGLMFVDEVYPDFSLLREVLQPPYFDSDSCSARVDGQSELISLLAQSQYREQPQDAAVELNGSAGQAKKSTLQCRRRASRGRKKRGANNRSSLVKADNWCLLSNLTKNSPKIGHKMSCVMEPEPNIIYLLEESMNKLPRAESNPECDQVSKSSCSMNEEHIRTPFVKNGYRMTPCSSTMTSNAMELLNLINIKCTNLNNLGGDLIRIEDMDDQQRNGSSSGYIELVKDIIPNSDMISLDSAKKPDKVQESEQGTSIKNCQTTGHHHNSSTSSELPPVERPEDPSGQCFLLNPSTDCDSCVRKTSRKQRTPTKGVEKQDPSFHGIEFQIHLCFEKEKYDDYHLTMSSFYRRGRRRRKSTKSRLRFKSTSLSSGSEDDHIPATRNKQCASCKTQKTPLWRDAEDGTPLCNACGIRYKKYGMRCGQCWNIPKKDGKSCSKYCACGGMFRAPV